MVSGEIVETIVTLYFEYGVKQTNGPCGQNAEYYNAKAGGTYGNHHVLNGQGVCSCHRLYRGLIISYNELTHACTYDQPAVNTQCPEISAEELSLRPHS
jgi:hypothetical protein